MSFALDENLVLAASAGTGKTHALVGVIVNLVVCGESPAKAGARAEPLDPSRIVATTFSRKAAAEIHARVTRELERLASAPASSVYVDDLLTRADVSNLRGGPEGSVEVLALLSRRAKRALSRMDAARFGTLHSFAMGLVREHAVELGFGAHLDLASEVDGRARMEDAVARSIERRLGADATAMFALAEASGGIDGLVDQLRRILVRLEEDGRSARDLSLVENDHEAVETTLRTLFRHAEALVHLPKFEETATSFVSAWNAKDDDRIERALIDFCAIDARGKDDAVRSFGEFRKDLPGQTNLERARRLARTFRARHLFASRAALVRDLLADAESDVAAIGRETASLGFGEILRAARQLLRDHPAVAEEISEGIDALLVDEFQDTSRVQRDLLQLLWARPDRRVAGIVPDLSSIRKKGLLVVGDRKQSIYGFRGADVGVFAELAVGLAGEKARVALGVPKGATSEPIEPLAAFRALRHNRRSNAELLAFANAFSARRFVPEASSPQLYEIAYVPETEDLLVPPERVTTATAEPRTVWLRISPKKTTSSRIEEALVIAERISRIVRTGAPRVARDSRAPSFRDIAVLATSNAMLDATSFALAQAGIPYVVAGRSFFRTREVRDLTAMLSLVLDPTDRLASLAVLRGPWASVHDETLLALTHVGKGLCPPAEWTSPPHPQLVRPEDVAVLETLAKVVHELGACVLRVGPGTTLREAVRSLRLEDVLSRLPRGEQRVANVRKLLSMADRHTDARAFLASLNEAADEEFAEAEAATFSEADDAVRLLTVHASKGLDFPLVFVPEIASPPARIEKDAQRIAIGAGGDPNVLAVRIADEGGMVLEPPSFAKVYDADRLRQRAERQRLAYVAVTRAADAMFLVGGRARTPKNEDVGATSIAALEALAADEAAAKQAFFVVEDVLVPEPALLRDAGAAPSTSSEALDERPFATRTPGEDPPSKVAPPPVRVWRSLSVAPTALSDFDHCARRFELIHVLGLPERLRGRLPGTEPRSAVTALDAREQGTLAHAVLERVPVSAFAGEQAHEAASAALEAEGIPVEHPQHETIVSRVHRFLHGDYAKRVATEGGEVRREVAFVLEVVDPNDRRVVLRGSMDLVVVWPDGTVDVVDYKSGRGRRTIEGEATDAAGVYAFQLDVYALAARALHPSAPSVRVGLVFLGGGDAEPVWRDVRDEAAFRAHVADLGDRLVSARVSGIFPRVSLDRCESIYCGHIGRCHGSTPTGTDAYASLVTTT